ncbi:MAG: sigma-70 family RNA polymerase sigma factor [Clostridia bacterium]|nr:sigma-70 family RNA polymerase sigma factor [Clostridia bacterium]
MLLFYLSLIDTDESKDKITKIYESYLDWMLKIAFHYLQDERDAEDAVNDVFLSIINNGCSVPDGDEDRVKSYLYICIKHSSLKISRSKCKGKTISFDSLFNVSSKFDIEDELLKKDRFEAMLRAIDTLPSIYRDVLTMYIVFEKSLKEIADLTGVSYKTVATRFRRGRAILKERLGDIDI